MTWPVARIGDHFHVKHGYAFKGKYFETEGPYVLLTPGSFNEEEAIATKVKGQSSTPATYPIVSCSTRAI